MSREFLVTKFACAACGSLLTIEYAKPSCSYAEGEPTGAAMVEQTVLVKPCKECMRPVEEVKRALQTLGLYTKEDKE